MVYQMPCPGKYGVSKEVFVASSYQSKEQAYQELRRWAAGNGYRFAALERTFTVYGREQQPRQWVLLERSDALVSGTPPEPHLVCPGQQPADENCR